MGLGGQPSATGIAAPPARPLYRDDEDGTYDLRLKRLLAVDLPVDDRHQLLERLDRATRVTGAGWAAMLLARGEGVEAIATLSTPATLHRQLAALRIPINTGLTKFVLPEHVVNRAASQGYVVRCAGIRAVEGLEGQVILGFPAASGGAEHFADLVQLVADDLCGFLESMAYSRQIERIQSHLSLVHRLGQQVTAIHDREALFEEITRLLHRSLGYDHIQLLLSDPITGAVELAHASGPFAEQLQASGFREPVGRGIIGRVAQTGRPWMSQDVTRDSHFVSHVLLPNTAAELALPLRLGQRVIGVLDIQSDRRDAFRRDDVILLQTIADQIAPAIEQHRLFAAERRERELANTLADVSRIISSKLEPHRVLEAVLQELGRVVPNRGSRVTLLGDDGRMRVVAAKGYPDNGKVKQFSFLPGDAPLSAPVVERHRTLIIADVREEPLWFWQPGTEQVRSWCSAPLVHGRDCIGWLCVDWPEPGFYQAEHGRVVRAFADQAVIAIENARLFERARELSDILEYKVNDRTRQLRAAHDEIARKAAELQALWRRVVEVQELERKRIAHDLHDSVAQSILASTYELQAVRRRVRDNPDLDERLSGCQRMLDATLQEMKQIIYALRPAVLDELGLIPALENYIGALPQVGASLRVEGVPFALGGDVELAIYRIVQETCQNTMRHASARSLELVLDFAADSLRVTIHDDGRGFSLDGAELGLGLVGIRERTQSVGGHLVIQSRPSQGTSIIFDVPRGP